MPLSEHEANIQADLDSLVGARPEGDARAYAQFIKDKVGYPSPQAEINP